MEVGMDKCEDRRGFTVADRGGFQLLPGDTNSPPSGLLRLAEMAAQLRAMDERLTRLELEVADYRTREASA